MVCNKMVSRFGVKHFLSLIFKIVLELTATTNAQNNTSLLFTIFFHILTEDEVSEVTLQSIVNNYFKYFRPLESLLIPRLKFSYLSIIK